MPERYILIKMQQWRSIDLIHVIGVFQAVEDLFFRKFMSFVFFVNFSVNSLKLIFNYFFQIIALFYQRSNPFNYS